MKIKLKNNEGCSSKLLYIHLRSIKKCNLTIVSPNSTCVRFHLLQRRNLKTMNWLQQVVPGAAEGN